MRAGPLRHRVTQQRSVTVNNGGVPTEDWSPIPPDPDWANVQELTQSNVERVFAAQVIATANKVIEMRYRSVRVEDRFVWHDVDPDGTKRDRNLYVTAVADPEGRKRRVLIAAMERAA